MTERQKAIRLLWRADDTIRAYRDTPDKRGVSELVIDNTFGIASALVSNNVGKVLIEL